MKSPTASRNLPANSLHSHILLAVANENLNPDLGPVYTTLLYIQLY